MLIPSAAYAVECVNGGAGGASAGSDFGIANSTACGNVASANGQASTAFGYLAGAGGDSSVAIGAQSSSQGTGGVAIGPSSTASGYSSTATGPGSTARGSYSSAFGFGSTATGNESTALGVNAQASGANSIAIGGNQATAPGNAAFASGTNAIAIGNGAQAPAANSVAIGSGSVASAPNTVSFGSSGNERRLTNVAAGIAPTDAVNVSQLNSFASGWTAGLQNQINTNQTEARAGIALALASSALQYDPRPGKLSVAAAVGNFRGQSALASGLGYAISSQWRVNASFTATPQVNQYGAAIGSSWTLN
ncbi:YadA family autotransporter adhesin [Bradyrhizobium neotropicale]|uniref:Trimeric autotransporter adhesin YadA-like C-terminal membrane anchor domain-containing protein n=1 Tax=Bradyrhizobium neotropicale TaxID=1497615 RepID=A0A176YXG5_9BRAD|nr:YadA-like family protein [Bradyrhizobium neotropicale]OAF11574.1 hypothetical protein AXW67_22425 [Bradyrhizobium neotropicale]